MLPHKRQRCKPAGPRPFRTAALHAMRRASAPPFRHGGAHDAASRSVLHARLLRPPCAVLCSRLRAPRPPPRRTPPTWSCALTGSRARRGNSPARSSSSQFENRQLKEQLASSRRTWSSASRSAAGARPAPARRRAATSARKRRAAPAPPRRPPARRRLRPRSARAPGAPRQLGAAMPSAPLPRSRGRPAVRSAYADRSPARRRPAIGDLIEDDAAHAGPPAPRSISAAAARGGPRPPPAAPRPSVAGRPDPRDARADYDVGLRLCPAARQYEQAEMGFRAFLQSHPRDRLAPDATYWLGESYLRAQPSREAAEQFLKVSTDYPKSAKAPDAHVQARRRAGRARRHAIRPAPPSPSSSANIPQASAERAAGRRARAEAGPLHGLIAVRRPSLRRFRSRCRTRAAPRALSFRSDRRPRWHCSRRLRRPDSVALMRLAAALRHACACPAAVVATVDHGLRPDRAPRPSKSRRWAADVGLSAPHPDLGRARSRRRGCRSGARDALYRLLAARARDRGLLHPHRPYPRRPGRDRADAAGARHGLAGLGRHAATSRTERACAIVAAVSRLAEGRLVATCRAEGWPFLEDPSNADPRFARARLRGSCRLLARAGLTPERLASLAARARRAEDALEARIAAAITAAALEPVDGPDAARLPTARCARMPDADLLRPSCLRQRSAQAGALTAPARCALERLEARCCAGRLRGRARRGERVGSTLGRRAHGEIGAGARRSDLRRTDAPTRSRSWRMSALMPQQVAAFPWQGGGRAPKLDADRRERPQSVSRLAPRPGADQIRMNPNFRNFALWVDHLPAGAGAGHAVPESRASGRRQRDHLQPAPQRGRCGPRRERRHLRAGDQRHLSGRPHLHDLRAERPDLVTKLAAEGRADHGAAAVRQHALVHGAARQLAAVHRSSSAPGSSCRGRCRAAAAGPWASASPRPSS